MKVFAFAIYPYIIKQYQSMFENIMKEYDLTQIEIDVLAFLANNPEYKYAQDIVKIRGISKAHASIAIEKLVKKNYITRTPDSKNRRCNILLVKPEASTVVKKIQEIQMIYNEQAFQGFTNEENKLYHQLLDRVYHNLGGGIK